MSRPRANDGGEIAAADARLLLRALAAAKKGDFSLRLPADRSGATARIFDAFNDITELSDRLTTELAKMRMAVGEEGRIGRRMQLTSAPGAWGQAVESVNALVWGLAQPITETNRVIRAVAHGDLSQRAATDVDGRPLKG